MEILYIMVEYKIYICKVLTNFEKLLANYFAVSKIIYTFAAEKRKGYEYNLVQKDNKE